MSFTLRTNTFLFLCLIVLLLLQWFKWPPSQVSLTVKAAPKKRGKISVCHKYLSPSEYLSMFSSATAAVQPPDWHLLSSGRRDDHMTMRLLLSSLTAILSPYQFLLNVIVFYLIQHTFTSLREGWLGGYEALWVRYPQILTTWRTLRRFLLLILWLVFQIL